MSSVCPQRKLASGVDSSILWEWEACISLPLVFYLIWKQKKLKIHLTQEKQEHCPVECLSTHLSVWVPLPPPSNAYFTQLINMKIVANFFSVKKKKKSSVSWFSDRSQNDILEISFLHVLRKVIAFRKRNI